MAGSVGQAFAILKGRRPGDVAEAEGLLGNMSTGTLSARLRSESKTNSRPKFYKKYKMGMRVY